MNTAEVPAAARPGASSAVQVMRAEVAATNPHPKTAQPATAPGSHPAEDSPAVDAATTTVVSTQARDAGNALSTPAVRTVAAPPTPMPIHATTEPVSLAPAETRWERP